MEVAVLRCGTTTFTIQNRLFRNAKQALLHCKIISKIQLIGNKKVSLFVKLNR